MSNLADVSLCAAKGAIVDILRERAKKALFVTELAVSLRRKKVGKDEMEQSLSDLQTEGVLIMRDNFCADPHLANVDLRVVAPVDKSAGADAHAAALREIDITWNKWLGEYLANHRCG
mgnify:CR=1 FL=1